MATSYRSDRTPTWAEARAAVIENQFAGVTPTGKGWYLWRECPFCHKKKKGSSAFHADRGLKSFCCPNRRPATIEEMIDLAGGIVVTGAAAPAPVPREPQLWQYDPMHYHGRYTSAYDVVERWQAYKPITHDSILRFQLGYGVLPPHSRRGEEQIYTMGCRHKRLIYANIENRERTPIAFRGRRVDCECCSPEGDLLKWLTVRGADAWLWGESLLAKAEGRHVITVENPVDAILTMQAMPEVIAVAGTGGAATWRPAWTQAIADARPKSVLVADDNDLIGCPNEETRLAMLTAWVAKQTVKRGQPPSDDEINREATKAMGPRKTNALRAAGVKADMWAWPEGTRPKMDFGQYLIDQGCFR